MIKIYLRKTKAALATLMLLPFFSFAQINLLQTTNNVVAAGVVQACGSTPGVTFANSFARLYNLTALGYSSFQVTKISFAVQGFQLGTAATFPVNVEVYSSTGGTASSSLTLRGSATINITTAMVGTVVEVPLSTPVTVSSAGMLIAVSAPSGQPTSTGFYLGGNSNGQTASGYIKASTCGLSEYGTFASIGNTNAHIVLFPTGNPTFLGVENLDSANKNISLYPNPVKSIANFSEEVSNIKITDLSGRTVKQIPASAKTIDVETLEKGTYIITATTKAGNTVTKKLVKE